MTAAVLLAVLLAGRVPATSPDEFDELDEVRLHWRDGRSAERGVLLSIGPDGLQWRRGDGTVAGARWSSLREVDGLGAEHRDLLEDGGLLWRATSRLERGEIDLAAPIFERLADRWSGEVSRRHRAALAGLVRCRARTGRPADAAIAALRLLELDAAGGEAGAEPPRLPGGWPVEAPLWRIDEQGEEAARLRVALKRYEESPVAASAAWVEATLLGVETAIPAGASPASPARVAAVLREIDRASPEALLREREALLEAAATTAEERWIHARIATVLAADAAADRRRRALVEWLCVPARFPDSVEAPLALRAAAELADGLGEDDLARRLGEAAARAASSLRSRPVPRTTP